ncbi:hypothetical protein F5Y09DRAFT_56062 [Xylaria sp. FL1042]|nr:hypothetical protein F5Y09DRAFT_56062 [Xylaria sp. FL1042]
MCHAGGRGLGKLRLVSALQRDFHAQPDYGGQKKIITITILMTCLFLTTGSMVKRNGEKETEWGRRPTSFRNLRPNLNYVTRSRIPVVSLASRQELDVSPITQRRRWRRLRLKSGRAQRRQQSMARSRRNKKGIAIAKTDETRKSREMGVMSEVQAPTELESRAPELAPQLRVAAVCRLS